MAEKIPFLHMFPDYTPPARLIDTLGKAVLVSADVNAAARRIDVQIHSDVYVSRSALDAVQREIAALYRLNDLTLSCQFPKTELTKMDDILSSSKIIVWYYAKDEEIM